MNRTEVNRTKETQLGFTNVNECTKAPTHFAFDLFPVYIIVLFNGNRENVQGKTRGIIPKSFSVYT